MAGQCSEGCASCASGSECGSCAEGWTMEGTTCKGSGGGLSVAVLIGIIVGGVALIICVTCICVKIRAS